MTTGETARGRSMNALSSPLPGKRRLTTASPQSTPKTVLSGTAIPVAIKVTSKA